MRRIRAEPRGFFYFIQNCAGANRRKSETVKEILMQTYTIVLPVLLGYIVWLLKNQKKTGMQIVRGLCSCSACR